MKKIRMFALLALAVLCLTALSGCGRGNGNDNTDSSDMQNGTDQTVDHAGTRGETHEATGGVIDDIGNGITDAVDDLGNAAGDVMDDLMGDDTTESTDRNTNRIDDNRMR